MVLKCDVCLKSVSKGRRYALTTTQVATTPAFWEYAFTHQWSYVGKSVESFSFTIQEVGEFLTNLAQQVSSGHTPWLVCDSCINLFRVDRNRSLELAKRFTLEMPNGWRQITGTADFERTLAAAKNAYRSVFQAGRNSKQTKAMEKKRERSKTPAGKCDFCGRKLGKHEEIAFLNEKAVAAIIRAGVIGRSVHPSVTDPSGQSRWVACSKCRVRSGIDDAIAQGPSKKKWWQFWK